MLLSPKSLRTDSECLHCSRPDKTKFLGLAYRLTSTGYGLPDCVCELVLPTGPPDWSTEEDMNATRCAHDGRIE